MAEKAAPTKKIRNVSGLGDLDVPDLHRIVKHGDTVELPAAEADRYLLHPDTWEDATNDKSDKTEPTK